MGEVKQIRWDVEFMEENFRTNRNAINDIVGNNRFLQTAVEGLHASTSAAIERLEKSLESVRNMAALHAREAHDQVETTAHNLASLTQGQADAVRDAVNERTSAVVDAIGRSLATQAQATSRTNCALSLFLRGVGGSSRTPEQSCLISEAIKILEASPDDGEYISAAIASATLRARESQDGNPAAVPSQPLAGRGRGQSIASHGAGGRGLEFPVPPPPVPPPTSNGPTQRGPWRWTIHREISPGCGSRLQLSAQLQTPQAQPPPSPSPSRMW